MSNLTDTKNKQVDILMIEYQAHKQEVFHHLQFYQSLLTQFQFLFGATITILSFLISTPSIKPDVSTWTLWWCGSLVVPFVVNFQTLAIAQAIYHLNLLNGRLKMIEEKINKMFDTDLMIWDSIAVPRFLGSVRPYPKIVNPGPFWTGSMFIILAILAIAPPLYIDLQLWKLATNIFWKNAQIAVIVGLLVKFLLVATNIYTTYAVVLKGKPNIFKWFQETEAKRAFHNINDK